MTTDKGYKRCRMCDTPTHLPENGLCPACASMLYDWSKEELLEELVRYRTILDKRVKGKGSNLERRKK